MREGIPAGMSEANGHAPAEPADDGEDARFRRANLIIVLSLVFVVLAVTTLFGVVLREWLDANFSLAGRPLGFWFVQQGVIYVNLAAVLAYCVLAARLDAGRAGAASDKR